MTIASAVAMIVSALDAKRRRQRKSLAGALRRVGETCGLNDVQYEQVDAKSERFEIVGDTEGLLVRFEVGELVTNRARILITEHRPGVLPAGLTLRREDPRTSMRKRLGFREIEIGDPDFDQAIFIEGPPTLARAVLDAETRRVVYLGLFETLVHRSYGSASLETTDVKFEAGELRATVSASSGSALEEFLPDVLRTFLDTARRLMRPGDIAGRLAQTARTEPLADARLQDLLALAREFPEHPATRAALRAGLEDDEEEIRLRCAMALDEEGRDVLLDLASEDGTRDFVAARALLAVREHLSLERMQAILSHALKARRHLVAAAVLEALGHRHALEAIPMLVHVLGHGNSQLAVNAARALALSGLPAAERPLMEALGGDREVCMAAMRALGRVGSVAAVPRLKEASARQDDKDLARAARQTIGEIQSRVRGASPGQLSLVDTDSQKAGRLTLAEEEAGRLSLSEFDRELRSGRTP